MDVLAQWANYQIAGGASPATVRTRRITITALMKHAEVDDPLDLNDLHVVAFLARDLAPWSRLTYWRAIQRWSAFLVAARVHRESDLTRLVAKPRTPNDAPRPLDENTVSALLASPLRNRTRSFVLLALYQALRVSEVARVHSEDLDLDAGWMLVTGKGGKRAAIPIHPSIATLASSMPRSGWWFPSPTQPGRSIRPLAVSQAISEAFQAIGRPGCAHRLRHTAATALLRSCKDIRLVQAYLRHESVATTQRYTQVANDDLQAAVQGLRWDVEVPDNVILFPRTA